jgi:hypothetical protein
MKTIYISVAAYNEPHLELMISNCLENAEHPGRVNFGIWCHYNDGTRPDLGKYENVTSAFTDYPAMLGLCYGRLNSLSFYNNEDYCLQLDAHMLFEKNWDTKIINAFEEIKKYNKKPIISTYVPWWSMSSGKINYYSNDSNAFCSPMIIDKTIGNQEGYPKLTTKYSEWGEEKYKEHALVTGHFIFSEPSILEDVSPDPQVMFAGDEITTALRLWTRDYRMFTIKNPIVWHLNKFNGDLYYKDRLMRSETPGRETKIHGERSDVGMKRVKDILTGKILGYWGAPNLEKLKEFEKVIDLDFNEFYEG